MSLLGRRRLVGPAGDTLTALLDRLGFAPTTTSTERALAELGAPFAAERLDPLVEPTVCVGHLRRIE